MLPPVPGGAENDRGEPLPPVATPGNGGVQNPNRGSPGGAKIFKIQGAPPRNGGEHWGEHFGYWGEQDRVSLRTDSDLLLELDPRIFLVFQGQIEDFHAKCDENVKIFCISRGDLTYFCTRRAKKIL